MSTTIEEVNKAHVNGFKLTPGNYSWKNQHGVGGCAIGAIYYARLHKAGGTVEFDTIQKATGIDGKYLDAVDVSFESAADYIKRYPEAEFSEVMAYVRRDTDHLTDNTTGVEDGVRVAYEFKGDYLK